MTNTERPLVVVHVLTRLLRAGSEENTLFTCRAQVAAGHRVLLAHGREYDPAVVARARDVCEVVEVPELVHPLSPRDDPRALSALVRLYRRVAADVVHTHQSKAGVLGRVAARIAGTPVVVHGVHILPFTGVGPVQAAVYVAAERLCAPFTHAFVNVSPSVRDEGLRRGLGRPADHFVAWSAMEVDRFKQAEPPEDWRELLGVAPGAPRPPTAVMLAAFEPRKRHAELVRALPAAFAGLDDWRVVFAGQGAEEARVRALVGELGLADRVRFAGFRPDPERLVHMADVGLLTSEREGLPRVVVQFAAAGRPVVVTAVPGIEDVLVPGVSGVLVGAQEVDSAARETARLLADPAARADLARGAATVEVDRWSPASMDRSMREAYAHAASRSRATARGGAAAALRGAAA